MQESQYTQLFIHTGNLFLRARTMQSISESRCFKSPSKWVPMNFQSVLRAAIQFNSIQKIICIALHYRKSITGGLAQFSINLDMHLWSGVILI